MLWFFTKRGNASKFECKWARGGEIFGYVSSRHTTRNANRLWKGPSTRLSLRQEKNRKERKRKEEENKPLPLIHPMQIKTSVECDAMNEHNIELFKRFDAKLRKNKRIKWISIFLKIQIKFSLKCPAFDLYEEGRYWTVTQRVYLNLSMPVVCKVLKD